MKPPDRTNGAFAGRALGLDRLVRPYERIGLWGWLGLYCSGLVLLFFALVHVGLAHIFHSGAFTAEGTITSLRSAFVRFVELGLLLFAVVHGFSGIRRIVLDLEILRERQARYVTWGLAIVGLVVFVWGVILFARLANLPTS
jgi:succinate dehydrogenase hydrophobic anchor subunit